MIKKYCDTSNLKEIKRCITRYKIDGITTNPSIMRKDGVKNYKVHCKKILKISKNLPVSFEVFGDNIREIKRQALIINSFGNNVFVKIPITNTKGKFLTQIIKELSDKKIKINVTAVFTFDQVKKIKKVLNRNTKSIISIFAGRIADSGRDPEAIIKNTIKLFRKKKNVHILWASCREIFNFYQAKKIGCHIITMPPKMIEKLKKNKISLKKYSLNTVKSFYKDGYKSKFKI